MRVISFSRGSSYIILAVVLAAIERFLLLLQNRSFGWDESANVLLSQLSWLDILQGNYYDFAIHPWGYRIVLKLMGMISTSEFWLRLSSTIPSLLSIPVAYGIAKIFLPNIRSAGVATIAFAVSGFHAFHSSFVKETELALLWNLCALYYFLYYCFREKHLQHLIILDVFVTLSILTSYYSVWLLLLMFLTFLWVIKERQLTHRNIVLIAAHLGISCVFVSFWMVPLVQRVQDISELTTASPDFRVSDFLRIWGNFAALPPWGAVTYLSLGMLLLFLGKGVSKRMGVVFAIWAVFVPFIAMIISRGTKTSFHVWYMVFLSMPVYLLIGGLYQLSRYKNIGLVSVLVYFFACVQQYQIVYATPTEDWRNPHKFLLATHVKNTQDILYIEDREQFQYYDQRARDFDSYTYKDLPIDDAWVVDAPVLWELISRDLMHASRVCFIGFGIIPSAIPPELRKRQLAMPKFDNPLVYCFSQYGGVPSGPEIVPDELL